MIIEFYALKAALVSSFISLFLYRKLIIGAKCKHYEIERILRVK